jgi:hypothetical protein
VSDEPLPPPDTFVVGEFTVYLRPGLNRTWRAQIADRDGPCTIVRGQGRERAISRARAWCLVKGARAGRPRPDSQAPRGGPG